MIRLKLKQLKPHIIGWALFICYEQLVSGGLGDAGKLWDNIVSYCLNIAVFYFHAHVVLTKAFSGDKKKYSLLIAMIFGEFLSYLLVRYLIILIFNSLHIPFDPPFTGYITLIEGILFRLIYLLGLSTGYWFALNTIRKRKQVAALENTRLVNIVENKRLEKMLLAAENAYLKSQINPHFLLNTLNFLYNSVSKFSEKIADNVMSLSEILHYALTEADNEGKVRLESEIEHIRNFLNLNQVRFNQRHNVEFIIEGNTSNLKIIPMILITLVENLLKYGDLSNPSSPAKIKLSIVGNNLFFHTENIKKPTSRLKGHGIGIPNIKKRLSNYEYSLAIIDDERYYKSELKIYLS